ncbi:thermonuclease family protein [Microvirga sp. 2YAF29]|uniref:thermonuclease family protein n=1 Tax=Microvirga sp. 2YAF29 TaxID=3233031 RepID=UPI003F9EAD85
MRRRRRRFGKSGIQSLIIALALAGGAGIALKPNDRNLDGRAQVTDGDTIRIGDTRIRLKGIDAPEMQQTCSRDRRSYRCGDVARRALIDMISGEPIQCRASGRDRYRRILARCTIGGVDIGARMVEQGWAVSYGRDYDMQEFRAQSRSAGLWSGEFERPQDWRRRQSG